MKSSFFCVITLSIICLALSCKNNSSDKISSDVIKNPSTANGSTDSSDMPVFKFVEKEHNFGEIFQGDVVRYSFKFTNIGKSDLVISSAAGSCGCTVADFPQKPIPPGGDGQIDITFNSKGRNGFKRNTVTLSANTVPSTEILSITATIKTTD